MGKPFKISLEERYRVRELLVQGKNVQEICGILLTKYHLYATLEEIEQVYFPKTGTYAIDTLVGETEEVINERFDQITEYAQKLRERTAKLNAQLASDPELRKKQQRGLNEIISDPNARARRAKRNTERQRQLGNYSKRSLEYRQKWQDPLYRAKMVAFLSSPATRALRSEIITRPDNQSKIAQGRAQYWESWRQLPPEQQEPERLRRRNVANDPQNRARREEGKQRFFEELRQQPPEVREQLISPQERQRRREHAMQPEIQKKFREGYRRYVDSRRLLRAVHAYDNPMGWEDTNQVPITAPDYVDEIHRQQTIDRVHQALLELDDIARSLVCELFGINLPQDEQITRQIEKMEEEDKDCVLRAAFDTLGKNPAIVQLMNDNGGQ